MPSIDIIQNLSLKFSDFIKDNLKDINKLPQKQKQGKKMQVSWILAMA